MDDWADTSANKSTLSAVPAIAKLAANAKIKRIHVLAWRDLADVEAGGSEQHAAKVAAIWAQAGLEITMRTSYAAGAPPTCVRDGYRVVRKAGRYLIFPRAVLAELTRRYGRRDAVVEIWNGVPFFSPIWARGPRMTWLHHLHTEMWPLVLPPSLASFGQHLESVVAPLAYRRTQIVTLAKSSKLLLLNNLGFKATNVHVVPPGVDANFVPGKRKSVVPTVLAVGRLMPAKAFDQLLEVMVKVREHVRAQLTIVGEGYSRDALERQIRGLDAQSWCTLLGRVDQKTLIKQYQSAWVLAASSLSEGWGMTITEAAACATPAVATRIPGHLDAVRDKETGILVNNSSEFVAALVKVLSDENLRKDLAQQARMRASHLTWERTAHKTMAVLANSVTHCQHD